MCVSLPFLVRKFTAVSHQVPVEEATFFLLTNLMCVQVRHIRHCLSLVHPLPFFAKTLPFACASTAFLREDTAFRLCFGGGGIAKTVPFPVVLMVS